MISLLTDVGLRLSECTGLLVVNVSLPYLKVLGKGSKERVVALSAAMVKRLRKYVRVRKRMVEQTDADPEHLFPSRFGRQVSSKRFDSILKAYGADAGITGVRISAHTFRYTYASIALRNGMKLTNLQTCLGHTTLADLPPLTVPLTVSWIRCLQPCP